MIKSLTDFANLLNRESRHRFKWTVKYYTDGNEVPGNNGSMVAIAEKDLIEGIEMWLKPPVIPNKRISSGSAWPEFFHWGW